MEVPEMSFESYLNEKRRQSNQNCCVHPMCVTPKPTPGRQPSRWQQVWPQAQAHSSSPKRLHVCPRPAFDALSASQFLRGVNRGWPQTGGRGRRYKRTMGGHARKEVYHATDCIRILGGVNPSLLSPLSKFENGK